ncbi:DUF1774-domain-containing protein [Sporormia fimetaria CBS 119925]|uniref:DUF1774-domain-containing protein n=1 Tax=Sporormia fimetaria CBS 119925 TaxID=1340428 RepID=A0A6A6VHS2_9PLEO|nr:DUF1774-domain-containing protein [Sporormia fimetaria CBS 119925]
MPESGSTGGGLASLNPFSRRDEYSRQHIVAYRVSTIVTYLLLVITTLYYTFRKPHEGHGPHHRIWGNNVDSPFAQNSVMTSIYWIVLFIMQAFYTGSLYSSNTTYVQSAWSISGHHILSNLLLTGFVHLWVRTLFWPALLIIIINFFNLSLAYFRHSTAPRLIHIATVSGPLAWNFVALYWVGAVTVHAHHLTARIVANIFIWGFLAYGGFFLLAFKDYTMGYALSILAFSTGVGQFLTKPPVFQLQWIFAFTIGAILFVLSTLVALPGLMGREDMFARGEVVSEDRERAPLLADN